MMVVSTAQQEGDLSNNRCIKTPTDIQMKTIKTEKSMQHQKHKGLHTRMRKLASS